MRISDWSSDVCSSDLQALRLAQGPVRGAERVAAGGGDVAQGRREGDVGRRAQEAVHALAIGIELEAHHVAGVDLEQVAREVAVGVVVLAGVANPLQAGADAKVGGKRLDSAVRAV